MCIKCLSLDTQLWETYLTHAIENPVLYSKNLNWHDLFCLGLVGTGIISDIAERKAIKFLQQLSEIGVGSAKFTMSYPITKHQLSNLTEYLKTAHYTFTLSHQRRIKRGFVPRWYRRAVERIEECIYRTPRPNEEVMKSMQILVSKGACKTLNHAGSMIMKMENCVSIPTPCNSIINVTKTTAVSSNKTD